MTARTSSFISLSSLEDLARPPVSSQSLDRLKARILCDYVAGMTDGFAVRTYKRLFDPDYGSILDLV
jgi:dGTP triphosphohydrolase